MRAISLTQPWASLVAIGAKEWETRSWSTSFRGQIAIHAAKGFPRDCKDLQYEEPFNSALNRGTRPPLPLGAIIALATLTACEPTSRFRQEGFTRRDSDTRRYVEISRNEFAFGDYGDGRYAFRLENVLALSVPIPCKGALSIWPVPDDVVAQIHMQLVDMKHDEAIREESRGGIA
jgi:hypothetical protein